MVSFSKFYPSLTHCEVHCRRSGVLTTVASAGLATAAGLACPTKGPENVPAEGGNILLQRPGMFSGGEMPRRAWKVAADATAAAF
jgi:hypothetical protein